LSELCKTLELLNKRLDNFEGELKKVKESKQPDDQSKQQSSGNYGNYNSDTVETMYPLSIRA
jgi:hypothetical protein